MGVAWAPSAARAESASDHDAVNGPSYRWHDLRTGFAREVYDDIQQYRISSPDQFVMALF